MLRRLLLLVAVAIPMASCGESSPSGTSSTAAVSAAETASPTPVAITLPEFIARLQEGSQVAFTATYLTQTTSVKVEQQLPKYFSAITDTYSGRNWTEIHVTDGTHQYTCDSTTKTCKPPSFTLTLAQLAGYYTASYWVAEMQQWPTSIPGQYGAVTVTSSIDELAGRQVECLEYASAQRTAKVCILDNGVLASVRFKGVDFFLSEYAPGVTAGDFAVPAGYTVVPQ